MSRDYDHGKAKYSQGHNGGPGSGLVTRHINANDTMAHYGVKQSSYEQPGVSSTNYRMGQISTNAKDKYVDNGIVGSVFGVHHAHAGGYNAGYIAHTGGVSYQRQVDLLGARFDHAKASFAATGDVAFKRMATDIQHIAHRQLDVDRRQFRTPW